MSESISDVRFRELRDAGYTGSISDMERQRLLAKNGLTGYQNLSLSDLYRLADERPWPYSGFSPVVPPVVGPPITGYRAWYDFSDEASLTLAGSNITAINDKSGNAYHLVATGAGPVKTLSASLGGNTKHHAVFNGTDGILLSVASDLGVVGDYTTYVAAYKSTTSQTGANADPLCTLRGHSAYVSVSTFTAWIGTGSQVISNTVGEFQPPHVHTRQLVGAAHSYWMGGTQYVSSVGGNSGSAGSFMLGGEPGVGSDWCIGEAVVYNTVHSAGDRTSTINYLNAKWGTT